jgi:hypothetical protein
MWVQLLWQHTALCVLLLMQASLLSMLFVLCLPDSARVMSAGLLLHNSSCLVELPELLTDLHLWQQPSGLLKAWSRVARGNSTLLE